MQESTDFYLLPVAHCFSFYEEKKNTKNKLVTVETHAFQFPSQPERDNDQNCLINLIWTPSNICFPCSRIMDTHKKTKIK